jgi:hypothetical protein
VCVCVWSIMIMVGRDVKFFSSILYSVEPDLWEM